VLKRIAVRYRLRVDAGADTSVIDRVMGFHADYCPVARSLLGAIDIATSIDLAEA
jgi:uncharacterized OsmC-like protein